MATMTALKTLFALHPGRWRSISAEMFFVGAFTVFGTSIVLAFNRFGGLVIHSPQEFAQLALFVVWGWLGLGASIWFIGGVVTKRVGSNADQPNLVTTLTSVGLAHRPVLMLGAVLYFFTGLLQITGPGLVFAVFAFSLWFPTLLTFSVQYSRFIPLKYAVLTVGLPYLIWLAIVGRHLLDRVAHLL